MARDVSKSHKPRILGPAPNRFLKDADVSVNNSTLNPSRQKATGAWSVNGMAENNRKLRRQKLDTKAKAKPSYNPSKQKATGSSTLGHEIRNRTKSLEKQIIRNSVIRRSTQI